MTAEPKMLLIIAILLGVIGALVGRDACAQAWVLDVHGASWHSDRSAGYCERNPGLGITREEDRVRAIKAGAYRNSECHWSAYVGARWTPVEPLQGVRLGAVAGVVSGYQRAPVVPVGALVAVVDVARGVGVELMGGFVPRTGQAPATTVATISLRIGL